MRLGSSTLQTDRKSTRLNSSHTEIYTLSLHDALPIWPGPARGAVSARCIQPIHTPDMIAPDNAPRIIYTANRSEEHTSELQSHRDLHSFPTRRSSDLARPGAGGRVGAMHPTNTHARYDRPRQCA